MSNSQSLAIKGTILAAAILVSVLYFLSSQLVYPPAAYANATPLEPGQTGPESEENSATLEAHNTSPVECLLSPRFPGEIQQWCDLITQYAAAQGLAPDLVAALIWQESGGDPLAYSRSGAVGLMQVMPRDGLAAGFMCKNGPCFASRPTIIQLQDPGFNLEFGTRMLSRLIKRSGSVREALKAYGPMDVGYSYADRVLNLYQKYGSIE